MVGDCRRYDSIVIAECAVTFGGLHSHFQVDNLCSMMNGAEELLVKAEQLCKAMQVKILKSLKWLGE